MSVVDKASFAKFSSSRRRYREVEIEGLGTVRLRSITAGEFARVDAARTRAAMSGTSGRVGEQVKSLNECYLELMKLCVVDAENNQVFDSTDDEMLLGMDSAISDKLVAECIAHCDLDTANVRELGKN